MEGTRPSPLHTYLAIAKQLEHRLPRRPSLVNTANPAPAAAALRSLRRRGVCRAAEVVWPHLHVDVEFIELGEAIRGDLVHLQGGWGSVQCRGGGGQYEATLCT